MRCTLQDDGKWDMRQGPEERMRGQATAGERGRSQTAEEAGEGTGVGERVGLLAAQAGGLVPDGVVNDNRRAGWEAERTVVGETPGAMATGRRQLFAKMGAELRHLAAIVRCQLQHLVQTCQFAPFAVEGAVMQGLGHGIEITRPAQPVEAVTHALDFDLQPLLRGQVVERPHDPLAWCAGGLNSALQVEVQPRSGFLGTAKQRS